MTKLNTSFKDGLIEAMSFEIAHGKDLKARGVLEVEAPTAGEELAKGRPTVGIDEYIKNWEDKLVLVNAASTNEELMGLNY